MHVGRVPDGAGVGPVIAQRGVDQGDGRVPAGRDAPPLDATLELTFDGREGPRREVEELGEGSRGARLVCMNYKKGQKEQPVMFAALPFPSDTNGGLIWESVPD